MDFKGKKVPKVYAGTIQRASRVTGSKKKNMYVAALVSQQLAVELALFPIKNQGSYSMVYAVMLLLWV